MDVVPRCRQRIPSPLVETVKPVENDPWKRPWESNFKPFWRSAELAGRSLLCRLAFNGFHLRRGR